MKFMKVYGTTRIEVDVNPITVLEQINIIPWRDWVEEKDGKYIHMTEQGAGQHSFDHEVGEVSKEIFDLYQAQNLLIKYLEIKKL